MARSDTMQEEWWRVKARKDGVCTHGFESRHEPTARGYYDALVVPGTVTLERRAAGQSRYVVVETKESQDAAQAAEGPRFTHDCDGCRFLGRGKFRGNDVDVYICGSGVNDTRTLLFRRSDKESDYSSSQLFQCTQLTPVDEIALYNGLELTECEQKALLRVLCQEYRDKQFGSVPRRQAADLGLRLGAGNAMFGDDNP